MHAGNSCILFDTPERNLLYPFTYTRSIAEIQIGILTIQERWDLLLNTHTDILTEEYLQVDLKEHAEGTAIFINAAVFATENILQKIKALTPGEALKQFNTVIAFCAARKDITNIYAVQQYKPERIVEMQDSITLIKYPWHLVQVNDEAIRFDFKLITANRISQPISATNKVIAAENIFVEEGAVVEHSIINASSGPVYIAANAVVMEGCMIRGPLVLGKNAVLKMGSTIYGATTIGKYSIAGGEIKNSIMMGYSNKAHFGYLGDAVIGEWCNLGAGTSNSNVKNNATDIFIDLPDNPKVNAGLKCGLMMGDYSRCAIHTSFNTATFAGISCNIFGEGLTSKSIPNFTWGHGAHYTFDKAIMHIDNWKKLKNQTITKREIRILEHLYKQL